MTRNVFLTTGIWAFIDPITGKPVSNGDIYIGTAGTDPTVLGNRISTTVIQEDGTEVVVAAAAQPFSTGAGGSIMYLGEPVSIQVDASAIDNYSIMVHDANGSQVFYAPKVADLGDDNFVSKAGDQMLGQLKSVAGLNPVADDDFARKAYIDALITGAQGALGIFTTAVSIATTNGHLTLKSTNDSNSQLRFTTNADVLAALIDKDYASDTLIITNRDKATGVAETTVTLGQDGNISTSGGADIPTAASHLTRKDYVDSEILANTVRRTYSGSINIAAGTVSSADATVNAWTFVRASAGIGTLTHSINDLNYVMAAISNNGTGNQQFVNTGTKLANTIDLRMSNSAGTAVDGVVDFTITMEV